jgi:hypothetical protein
MGDWDADRDGASSAVRWRPGAAVLWRSVHDGVVRTAVPVRVVRDDPRLIALYLAPGTHFRDWAGRRGWPHCRADDCEQRVWHTTRRLTLYTPGDAHSVTLFWRAADGAFSGWYIDLERPWTRTHLGFDSLDQMLDIVIAPDLSSWKLKDEDELAWAQQIGALSPEEVAAVRAEAERAVIYIERRGSPYCDGWERWTPDPAWTIPELPAGWQDVETTD